MQLTGVFCCALLSITISSVCAHNEQNNDLQDIQSRKLRRRETIVFLDSLPTEKVHHKPKVIYRRISKHRYVHPNHQYGPPRSFYSPKPTRRPGKKYNAKVSTKYPVHKKPSHKPRYRITPPKRIAKPIYGPPIKKQKPHHAISNPSEPIGFAEPPKFEETNGFEQASEFDSFSKPNLSSGQSSYHGYGEPPVDSYGAPIEPNLHDLASPTIQSYAPTGEESQNNFDIWRNRHRHYIENQKAFSKNKPVYSSVPADLDPEVFVTPVPSDDKEEQNLNSYSDIYNYRMNTEKKKVKPNYVNHVKIMNKPWKGYKFSSKIEDSHHDNTDDEIIVGGQYAEPPARHIQKHQADIQPYRDEDFEDPDIVSSATNSPYINYKNSNVAFSPQNLNDAFSIVD